MPTSTNVLNLKINELTEAQYDTAVQGGVIGANELSILTDAEVGQVIQVATLPTASADELDNIYQFVGTTDANYTNGYFYKCVSDGQDPATYSWTAVEVQAGSGSSYTAGTGIDITGGVISVTSPTLTNAATGTNSITIGSSATTADRVTNIGKLSEVNSMGTAVGTHACANGISSVSIGNNSRASQTRSIAIGDTSQSTSSNAIAIGYNARSSNDYAIQIGQGTNSVSNTLSVGLSSSNNYELMSADGTIPHARLTNAVQSTTVTIATTDWSSNTASVTVSGLTATSVVWVAPDNASQSAYTTAGVYASSQSADTLTFSCAQTPTASLTVNIVWC